MAEVSKLLGHSSIRITEKYYGVWESGRQARMVERQKRRAVTDPILVKERARGQQPTKLRRVK